MKHNKIALMGMMGSGKSTIAKLLSKKLNFVLYELDEIFEKQENTSIKEFFKNFGEENFRNIETNILENVIKKEKFVISCGGGIILKEKNRKMLFSKDITTIYLEANSEIIYNRIKTNKDRPLLLVKNPKEEIEKILNSRIEFYNQAKFIIDTNNKTPDEITEEILNSLWKK